MLCETMAAHLASSPSSSPAEPGELQEGLQAVPKQCDQQPCQHLRTGIWGLHLECSSPGLQMVHLFVCSQRAMVLRADQEEKSALVLPSTEGNKVCREQWPRGTRDLEEL